MQVDIIKLAEIIGACSVVISLIIGIYKIYDKITDKLDALNERVTNLEKENKNIKKENALVIEALGACLDGLHQQGCNGVVTETLKKIHTYINNAAHDQDG